jgi:guanylate kinase
MLDERVMDGADDLEHRADELIAEVHSSLRARLYVISGPSGVGKDTVIDQLRERLPDFYFAVTATTRERRPGEIDGVHYYFMAVEEFIEKRDAGDFIESAEVYGHWYGVPRNRIRDALLSDRNVIVKVDVQGAATIRALTPEAILIFLMPTSMEELTRRLWYRKTDGPSVVMRRVRTASEELKAVRGFDYVIFNAEGELTRTLDEIMAIITAERLKVNQRETVL